MTRSTILAAICAAALASCGPLNEGNAARGALLAVQSLLSGGAATAPAPVLTRAQAAANPGAYLLVTAYGGASLAAMVPVKQTNLRTTWISADNVTVTLERGLMVATRGFPRDLMAADIRGVREAIAAGGGRGQRVHETLSDTDQIETILLQCSIALEGQEAVTILDLTRQTRRFSEDCEGENIVFTNTYWVGSAGEIIKSRQAVAADTGFLLLESP